jgi:uncharacterized protein YbjT (DUF2867 family)
MKVLLFGATGMVGQGVLRECLLEPEVREVLSIVRSPSGESHEKLREVVHADFLDFSAIEARLSGLDACFYCLGVSAAGMTEEAYHRVTFGFALAAAATLVRLNPGMAFIYVSGQGTDRSGEGRVMWARVKGRTENALFALPFRTVCAFRPGVIRPMHGARSKTRLYRLLYAVLGPLLPVLQWIAPDAVTTTERLGRAMLKVARQGAPKPRLETADINRLG